ncbi:MAG: hypothetical protein RL500_288, partial [Pseudomonadota bacterium]
CSQSSKNCDIKAADLKDASHKTAAMASNLLLIPLAKPGVVRDLLATNILLLRRERGMSQEALAFEVGLHRTFIAHVERQVRNISIDNVERIAVGLNVHPMVLLAPNHHVLKALQP